MNTINTSLALVEGPTVEPITLAEAREHLRLVPTGSPASHPDDSLIEVLIQAARQHFDGKEGWLGRALITQQWELTLDRFPTNEIRIPLPPLQQVDSIKYDDEEGAEQTVSPTVYVVDTNPDGGWVVPVSGESWPTTLDGINTVRILFSAGYGDAATDLPAPLIAAMKVLLAHLYANRDNNAEIPQAIEIMATQYRVWNF